MKIYEVSLETLEGGAVTEAVNIALEEVFADLLDLNKNEAAKRKVVLTITFVPSKDSALSPVVSSSVEAKLAPYRDIIGVAYIHRTGDKIQVTQVDPEQGLLPLGEPAEVKPFTNRENGGSNG